MALKHTFVGHKSQINSIELAQKAPYLASGSSDGQVMVWNVTNGTFMGDVDAQSPVNVVRFAPKKYWLVIGTENGFKIWDLPKRQIIKTIKAQPIDQHLAKSKKPLACTSLAWNRAGTLLFAGFNDNYIRVYKVVTSSAQ